MSNQVGSKVIDKSIIVCTVLMVCVALLFTSGILPYGSIVFLWQLVVVMWIVVLVAFILSRVQINGNDIKGINQRLDDVQVPFPEQSPGSSFIIPSYCPYCHAPIILEDAYWEEAGKLVCPECNKSILVRVVEDI